MDHILFFRPSGTLSVSPPPQSLVYIATFAFDDNLVHSDYWTLCLRTEDEQSSTRSTVIIRTAPLLDDNVFNWTKKNIWNNQKQEAPQM